MVDDTSRRWLRSVALAAASLLTTAAFATTGSPSADAASQPTGDHWQRTSGAQTLIYVNVRPSESATMRKAIDVAIARWNRSSKIELRRVAYSAGKRYPYQNVINVNRTGQSVPWTPWCKHGNTAPYPQAWGGYTGAGGHIAEGCIVFDRDWAGTPFDGHSSLVNAWCHEIGHTLGLDHPRSGPGPCKAGRPDSTDFHHVVIAHRHVDTGWNGYPKGL